MSEKTQKDNDKQKKASPITTILRVFDSPLSVFPRCGINAETNFLGLSIYAFIGTIIVFIVKFLKYGFLTACERASIWLILSVAAYAIGSILKAINANTKQLYQLRIELTELKQD